MISRQDSWTGTVLLAALGVIALGLYVVKAARPFSIVTMNQPLLSFAGVTGQTSAGVQRYLLTLGPPFLLYGAGFLVLWRWRVRKAAVFAFPVLFGLALFLVYPLTALDVFLYGAQGWTLVHDANPLVVPPMTFPENPFLPWATFVYRPSSYGPFGPTCLRWPCCLLAAHPIGTLLLFKLIGLAALLASTVLCYLVRERLQPGTGQSPHMCSAGTHSSCGRQSPMAITT